MSEQINLKYFSCVRQTSRFLGLLISVAHGALQKLAQSAHSKSLEEVNLWGCESFTDAGLTAMASSPSLTKLTTLDLGRTNINDNSLVYHAYSAFCKTLKELNFVGMPGIY